MRSYCKGRAKGVKWERIESICVMSFENISRPAWEATGQRQAAGVRSRKDVLNLQGFKTIHPDHMHLKTILTICTSGTR